MNGPIELVIFDLDGTLIHYELDYVFTEALTHLPSLGYPNLTLADLRHYFSLDDMFAFALEDQRELLENVFWEKFDRDNYPKPRLIDGTLETLEFLRAKQCPIAIATSRAEPADRVRAKLEAIGIAKYVSTIVTREFVEIDWRDKSPMYNHIFKSLDVDPASAIVVGDSPSDIKSANLAGLGYKVGVLSGTIYRDVLERENPTWIIDSVKELPNLLEHAGWLSTDIWKNDKSSRRKLG